MRLVKFMLVVSAITFAAMAILLIWSEDYVTCDIITCKVLETVFVLASLLLTKEVTTIKSWMFCISWLLFSCLKRNKSGSNSTHSIFTVISCSNSNLYSINNVNFHHSLLIIIITHCFILYIVISTDNNISFTCIVLTILYILL